jgi:phage gpG-like protein
LYHVEAGVHIVGTDQVQAAALEFGTNAAGRGHHTRILPRPYMRPALNEIRDHIGEVIALPLRFGDKF